MASGRVLVARWSPAARFEPRVARAAFLLNRDLRSRERACEHEQHSRDSGVGSNRTAKLSIVRAICRTPEREKAAIARNFTTSCSIMVARNGCCLAEKRLSHADDELKVRWTTAKTAR
jgi:hypothetical protein